MGSFFDRIQRLPKERRKLFAFAVASSFTALVFAVWIIDLDRRFGAPVVKEGSDELRGELSPFATIKRSADELVAGAKDRFKAVEEGAAAIQSFSETQADRRTSSSSISNISTTSSPVAGFSTSSPATIGPDTKEVEL